MIDIINNIASQFIKWPTNDELIKDEKEFRKFSNFPGVVGAIDGSHIPIKAPAANQMDYLNRAYKHTVNLLAVCNSNMQFTFINAGYTGSAHDNRVLITSGFNEYLETHMPQGDYHVIGDSAFAITRYMIPPYKDHGNLNQKQKKFNTCLSKTRVLIENAFGLLKGRFRRLKFVDCKIENISKIITVACVLHNICLQFPNNEITIEGNQYEMDDLHNIIVEGHDQSGAAYREYLLQCYF